ncbi:tRNA uridine-5-carboxymethylaminomethyl(34) synthesis GTPase MnmE [Mesorhizobium sp. SB112]|uniref:tRNA uridine-5-carboxymethylaminomethyl(34) synthesis GTPase MnmE n=1 Tax=Mesorhizobium sp. SB112 TaxID=3151853 RepID=UPI00326544AC
MAFANSIFALSSGRLPSGVAIVRVSGPHSRQVLETVFGSVPASRLASFGPLKDIQGNVLDRALAMFFPGPNSFTGEDVAEFHLHGGRAVVASVLNALSGFEGLTHAEAGEFTKRAFLNGKLDLLEAEALADLIASETEAQRRFAVTNSFGAQSELYQSWRKRLIHARAMIEAEMDFADEGDIPGSVSATIWKDMELLPQEISAHISGFSKAEIIRDGFEVVILGAPNAGKSSLLNALAKRDAAIVSEEAGTTRDFVEVALDVGGVKIRLVDTAGIRDNAGKVEQIGIERALAKAKSANLALFLHDLSQPLLEIAEGAISDIPSIRVGTKVDLSSGKPEGCFDFTISAQTGEGLTGLLSQIGEIAAGAVGLSGDILPSRLRHVSLLTEAVDWIESAGADKDLELRAEDLRIASDRIGKVSGAVDVEDLLDVVFSQFCVGK